MEYEDVIADNPFDAKDKIHKRIVQALKSEILRLKLKCGEDVTLENLMGDFGQPHAFNIKRTPRKGLSRRSELYSERSEGGYLGG